MTYSIWIKLVSSFMSMTTLLSFNSYIIEMFTTELLLKSLWASMLEAKPLKGVQLPAICVIKHRSGHYRLPEEIAPLQIQLVFSLSLPLGVWTQ